LARRFLAGLDEIEHAAGLTRVARCLLPRRFESSSLGEHGPGDTRNADDIEEERRLLYVAMTRAKDELALVVPHRFYVHGQTRGGDRHLYASRTRFIPAGILRAFDLGHT
jgi:superfamily I DNA/RNA helicase